MFEGGILRIEWGEIVQLKPFPRWCCWKLDNCVFV